MSTNICWSSLLFYVTKSLSPTQEDDGWWTTCVPCWTSSCTTPQSKHHSWPVAIICLQLAVLPHPIFSPIGSPPLLFRYLPWSNSRHLSVRFHMWHSARARHLCRRRRLKFLLQPTWVSKITNQNAWRAVQIGNKVLRIVSFPPGKTKPFSLQSSKLLVGIKRCEKNTVQQGQVLQSMSDHHTPILCIPLLMIKVNSIQQALPAQHVPKNWRPNLKWHKYHSYFRTCCWCVLLWVVHGSVPAGSEFLSKVPQGNWM